MGNRSRRDGIFLPAYFVVLLITWSAGGRGWYTVLPASNWVTALLLMIPLLPVNGLISREGEGTVLWGTAAELALFLLCQEAGTAALRLVGSAEAAVLYGGRVLALMGMGVLALSGLLRWLRERLADGDGAVRAVSGGALLVLFVLWAVQGTTRDAGRLWVAAALTAAGTAVLGGAVLLWERIRLRDAAQVRLMEQYLPMVEELVESVRARQHEYSNRVMSIAAAVDTASTLEEARAAVAELTGGASAGAGDRELLRCDSKLVSGLIFGKSRQAELRHVTVEARISAPFLRRSLTEAELVDMTGILLDNAIEASPPDATVLLRAESEDGALRLTVSNPAAPMSNTELVRMFRRGWSTKPGGGRGHGLANLRRMAEKCGGRVIARNEDIGGTNCLTVGAIIP